MRVLVVDDDEVTRTELAELLRGDGHDVTAAESGEAAVEVVRNDPPEVALVDLRMPDMDGIEALRRIRALAPATGVVLITGHATVNTAVEAMKAGAFDYVLKPFELDAVQRVLRAFSEQRAVATLLSGRTVRADTVFEAFLSAAARGGGVCLVQASAAVPRQILRDGRIRTVRVGPEGPDVIAPKKLSAINGAVEAFLRDTSGGAILIGCLRPLIEAHGEEAVAAWLRQVTERARARGVAVIVAARDERERALGQGLQSNLAEARQQAILESLANPIRRGIVHFLAEVGEASYSEILRRKFVDTSSKLSFHLQKLQADRVVEKRGGGRYGLTGEGRTAGRLAAAIGSSACGPVVVAVDPGSDRVERN